jgi:hypothetical protein
LSFFVFLLIGDVTGTYLGASSVVFDGLTHPATLEAIACSEVLSLAFDLNQVKLQIVTDCLEVVRNIREENQCVYDMVVKEFLTKKAMFQEVSVCHEYRECNLEAHNLVSLLTLFNKAMWLI